MKENTNKILYKDSKIDTFLFSIDRFARSLSELMGMSAESYCYIDTVLPQSKTTFIAKDRTLMTLVEVHGNRRMIRVEEHGALKTSLENLFSTTMQGAGRGMHFFPSIDPSGIDDVMKNNFNPVKRSCQMLNMDMADIVDEYAKVQIRYCVNESNYIVLTSDVRTLGSFHAAKISKKETMDYESKQPQGIDSQLVTKSSSEMLNHHTAYVDKAISELNDMGVLSTVLNQEQAVNHIRRILFPQKTAIDWKPTILKNKNKIKIREALKGAKLTDCSAFLPPRLSSQIMAGDLDFVDTKKVKIDGRYVGTVVISEMPSQSLPYQSLYNSLVKYYIPVRMAFYCHSDGLEFGTFPIKSMAATFTALTKKSVSTEIKEAIEELEELKKAGKPPVAFRFVIMTWSDDKDKLDVNISRIMQAVSSWGNAQVTERTGAPMKNALACVPMMQETAITPYTVAPTSDIVEMLPVTRPASPWSSGTICFRTPDGKPYFYEPSSSIQDYWLSLFFAPMGAGKSVLMHLLNWATTVSADRESLPLVSILDINESCSGYISIIQDSLPPELRYLARYDRIQNSEDFRINIFQSELGNRSPLPLHQSFIINFMNYLATPLGHTAPPSGVSGAIVEMVDRLFKMRSDEESPRTYTKGLDSELDEMIVKYNLQIDRHTTYLEITDAFFDLNAIHESHAAYRYACPVLEDCATVLYSDKFPREYRELLIAGTSESVVSYLSRTINEAIRAYPLLTGFNTYTVGDCRILALDLSDVAPSGQSPSAKRQTTIMYMLGMHVASNRFFLHNKLLPFFHPKYKRYYEIEITKLMDTPKCMNLDEYHRTGTPVKSDVTGQSAESAAPVRTQLIEMANEGRKSKTELRIASPLINHFDDDLVDLASSVFVLGANADARKIVDKFNMPPSAVSAIETLPKNKSNGAHFIGHFITKTGTVTHHLVNTMGSKMIFGFSTVREIKTLRDKLYSKMSSKKARELLALEFGHEGKAVEYIKKIKKKRLATTEEESGLVVDSIVDELLKKHPEYMEMH